jgi:hypothetical protein
VGFFQDEETSDVHDFWHLKVHVKQKFTPTLNMYINVGKNDKG